jgi:hypothetical protein
VNEFACFIVPLVLLPTALGIAAIAIATSMRSRVDRLQHTVDALTARLAGTPPLPVETDAAPVSFVSPEPASAAEPVVVPTPPQPLPVETEVPPVYAPPPEVAPVEPAEEPFAGPAAAPPSYEPAAAFSAEPPEPAIGAEVPPEAAFVPPPPPPPRRSVDWESFIGVKLFSWVAGIALALAGVLFLRYMIEHGWLSPPVQMAIGLIAGATLVALAELRFARKYATTANAVDAAGVAILYATLFAAHNVWGLINSFVAFLLIVAVTGLAVFLAIRRDSIFIALLGLLGGFATPAILSSGEDRPIALFGYLLVVNVGAAWVAYKRRWPLLTILSLLFTTIYQWHWVVRFLDRSSLPVAVGIFLAFPIAGVIAMVVAARDRQQTPGRAFERTTEIASALPLVFGLYASAIPAYGENYRLLFAFLFIASAGLGALAIGRRNEALHLLGAGSAVVAVFIWFSNSYTHQAWPHILAIAFSFQLLYFIIERLAVRFGRPFEGLGRTAIYAAPLLMFVLPTLAEIEPLSASGVFLFPAALVMLAAAGAYAAKYDRGWLFLLAAVATIAMEIVWASDYLSPDRVTEAMILFTAVSLIFAGVPVLARRWDGELRPAGGTAFLLLASVLVLFFFAQRPIASISLPGVALVMAVVAGSLMLDPSHRRSPLVITGALLVMWFVLGAVWTNGAMTPRNAFPAMAVAAGLSLLVIGASAWVRSREDATNPPPAAADYLAMVSFLFLGYVASEESLHFPVWRFLLPTAVILVAVAAASLRTRRVAPFGTAVALTDFVLMSFEGAAQNPPWPSFLVLSTAVVAAFCGGLTVLSLRRGTELRSTPTRSYAKVTVMAAFIGSAAAMIAADAVSPPPFAVMLAGQLFFVLLILYVAYHAEWHGSVVGAAFTAALAMFAWREGGEAVHPMWQDIAFGILLYAPFVAYPLILGSRLRTFLAPHIASIVAGAGFVLYLRSVFDGTTGERAIGLVPLAVAGLLGIQMRELLRVDPGGASRPGRLALMAAAILAFVTVAVPMQLDNEWITVAWALESAALAWLFTRLEHRQLFYWSAALALAVFVRLSVNPAVLEYHQESHLAFFNWYLYTYVISAAALFIGAYFLRRMNDSLGPIPRVSSLFTAGATILLFLVMNIEIADYYSQGAHLTFNFSSTLAQDLTYTLAWAVFAIAMLLAGIVWGSRAARIASIGLLSVAALKCFLHDLARLGGLYRVGSLVGLALSLGIVAVLLQRFVLASRREATTEAP